MQLRRLLICLCAPMLIACLPTYVNAAAIELKNVAEVEMQSINSKGEKELKRMPAKTVPPGGEVTYTTTFRNVSDKPVGNVIITNPVPQNTLYIANSAVGSNTDISYSLNGKSYDIPENLQVPGAHGKGRPAIASDYTNVRWVYKGELDPGKSGEVAFRVKVR